VKAGLDRDRTLDKALRQAFETPAVLPATDACLDAETLAAWTDDGLDPAALAQAEAHVSSCARCQTLVAAMARTLPEVSAHAGAHRSFWRWWLAPVAAAAAAAVLWIVVPDQRDSVAPAPPAPPAVEQSRAPAEGFMNEPRPPAAPSAPSPSATARRPTEEARRQESVADAAKAPDARNQSTPRATAAPSMALKAEAPRDVVSPDPAVRWRIGASGVVDFTTNGGGAWERVTTGVTSEITGGASPSTMVCWLVGHGGLVLITTDGRTFTRVTSPVDADLGAVQATDARRAVVTTADGRAYETDDGGLTWRRRP
jgi:hypothetical protein